MSKLEKALEKLLREPKPKDFTWEELILVMTSFNFRLFNASRGSGRKFIHSPSNYPFSAHEPHPGNIVKGYVISAAIQALQETGELK